MLVINAAGVGLAIIFAGQRLVLRSYHRSSR